MKMTRFGIMVSVAALTIEACGTLHERVAFLQEEPVWATGVLPRSKDFLYGVAAVRSSTLEMSRTTAIERARDDLARQVRIEVKTALISYGKRVGEADNQLAFQYFDTVSQKIADIVRRSCSTEKVIVSRDETLAVVFFAFTSLMDIAMTEFSRKDAAPFPAFRAAEAVKQLEQLLESDLPTTTTRSNPEHSPVVVSPKKPVPVAGGTRGIKPYRSDVAH